MLARRHRPWRGGLLFIAGSRDGRRHLGAFSRGDTRGDKRHRERHLGLGARELLLERPHVSVAFSRAQCKRRRMGQMADIRASTARMWEDHASGEDLVALLQTPGHGHSVLVEPEHPAPGHVYGATFVRIDEGRILKLRLPLDVGFESVGPAQPAQPELPVLLDPEGNDLPPLLSPDGTPLALPPLPAASSALDALRKEMED